MDVFSRLTTAKVRRNVSNGDSAPKLATKGRAEQPRPRVAPWDTSPSDRHPRSRDPVANTCLLALVTVARARAALRTEVILLNYRTVDEWMAGGQSVGKEGGVNARWQESRSSNAEPRSAERQRSSEIDFATAC